MRRLFESDEAFARRKAADIARWRRNSELDQREQDPRDDDRHSRFHGLRCDPRMPEDDDADEEDDVYTSQAIALVDFTVEHRPLFIWTLLPSVKASLP